MLYRFQVSVDSDPNILFLKRGEERRRRRGGNREEGIEDGRREEEEGKEMEEKGKKRRRRRRIREEGRRGEVAAPVQSLTRDTHDKGVFCVRW